jgi:UDP-glucose 4-epimerase
MKVLITGGAGYIGYALIERLMRANVRLEEIVVYDNLSRGNYAFFFNNPNFRNKPIRFVQAEILDSRRLAQAMKGCSVVVHLAAKVTTPYADMDAHFFEQVNHWGTATVVNAVEETGVPHLIHLSSMAVYGSSETGEPVTEDSPLRPESFYGISKVHAEEHILRLESKVKTQILRAANVYGHNPTMRMDAVINRFMFEANFYGRVSINGTGEQRRSFIHVDKLAYAIEQLMLNEKIPSGTYNYAEHNLSVNDIVDEIEKIYPNLERLYVAKHMSMRQITASTLCRICQYLAPPRVSLQTEMQAFKDRFSF